MSAERVADDLRRLGQDVARDREEIDREFPEQEEADEEGDEHPRPRDEREERGATSAPRRAAPGRRSEDAVTMENLLDLADIADEFAGSSSPSRSRG